MQEFAAPFIGSVQSVEDQWIDYNGHFNMAYYAVLFDRCGDEAFAEIGLGADYLKETNCSYFTLETHTNYLRELHAGDRVRVTVQLLDYDAKRLHYYQEMLHAEDGWLSATMEAICMHVDLAEKKSTSFPADMRLKIAAMYEAHKSLPAAKYIGRKIGIVRKVA